MELIRVLNLKKYFPVKSGIFSKIVGWVKAVDDISFTIKKGETLGLVGESGCGKTTLGRTILLLTKPTSGKIFFENIDLTNLNGKEIRNLRRQMQIIFQDPFASLNPRMTIGDILGEPFKIHRLLKGKQLKEKIEELMRIVGLDPRHIKRYPHEFSGGQRQRIGIARAIALNPKFIVADEPVSALDVSIQSQIINLLEELQDKFNLTYLFIAHDLNVVHHISNRIAVMYLGKIIELASSEELFNNPLHPYTKALLSAIPKSHPKEKVKKILLKGEVPSPINPPKGCNFHPRCFYPIKEICKNEPPKLLDKGNNHFVSCHLVY